MKNRLKTQYIVTGIIWILLIGFAIFYNKKQPSTSILDLSNLTFTGVGVLLTLISIAISDRKKPTFEGKVLCWVNKDDVLNVNNPFHSPEGKYTNVTFKVDNFKRHVINSLTINIRIPSIIYYRQSTPSVNLTTYEFKETIILTHSGIKFLGTTNGDSDVIIEHHFNFDAWNKNRVAYVTISGDNIVPITFKIDNELRTQLLTSTSKNPITLPIA
jgi:hypothetical protein